MPGKSENLYVAKTEDNGQIELAEGSKASPETPGPSKELAVFKEEISAARELPPIGAEIAKKEESYGVELPPEKRLQILEADQDIEKQLLLIKLKGEEEQYLVNHKVVMELEGRFNSTETEPAPVLAHIKEFSDKVGVEAGVSQELVGKPFSSETKAIIAKSANERIAKFLLNKETGRFNPAKNESLVKQTERYLELIGQAQAEGDIDPNLTAEDLAKMVNENIDKLAYQDRAAAENMFGDHGIRHLVDHNINVSEKIFDKLQERGQAVKAIDRLMAHQIMIDHDLGYAMSVVRDRVNAEGIKGQDAGHNLLSAKFTGERLKNPNDHFNKVFKKSFVEQIHSGELNHDSSSLEFTVGDDSAEARRKNLESAIHLADNTHAFEDKLPELLYSVPETLKYMRLMKVAGETGDTEKVEEIKQKLSEFINSKADFSPDDKEALNMAIKGVNAESYRFTVGRICGNKPEFEITENGKVEITIQESAIHREVMAVFDQDALKQLQKFIKDLGGPKDISVDTTSIDTEKILFKLATGDTEKSGERNDYQERVMSLISEEKFRSFVIAESDLSNQQKTLEDLLKLDLQLGENRKKFLAAGEKLNASDGLEMSKYAIQFKVAQIRDLRQSKLTAYLAE
jgi:hypothetical protein